MIFFGSLQNSDVSIISEYLLKEFRRTLNEMIMNENLFWLLMAGLIVIALVIQIIVDKHKKSK